MTVFIVVMMATFLMVGTLAARRSAAVQHGAEEVASALRAAGVLALNGVKAPGCARSDISSTRRCSQYVVSTVAGSRAYERQAAGGGGKVSYLLPAGARFLAADRVTFEYTPPTLTASPAVIKIRHLSGSPTRLVCVRELGAVEVRRDAC